MNAAARHPRAPRPTLTTELAMALFGWQWQEDWQCWCPPGWPARAVINPPYLDKLHALREHGADPRGRDPTDARGRPIIPDYCSDPEATEILWEWLHAQPGIASVRFVPLAPPLGSLVGTRPWRCEIIAAGAGVVSSDGDSHQEALCRAVLALAHTHAAAKETP